MTILECVPNVSEGRRADVLAACDAAIRGAGAALLDASADAAHNRAVYTFAGAPPVVEAAALALFSAAIARIDLRRHAGVHPRLGAVDVVPFVPLGDATMDLAIAAARAVGAAVAQRFDLPVFLYEAAATGAHRTRLEDIRRGAFEGLATKLARPEWAPDFGPARPHPSAGAAVIGARWPLIAYNINLATDQLEVAKQIAATIRESSGGFRFVKALGLPLESRGIVQVSMNLTNYRETSMLTVFDAVEHLAAGYNVHVLESELIGLVPRAALPASPETTLLLTQYQVLEDRLALFSLPGHA